MMIELYAYGNMDLEHEGEEKTVKSAVPPSGSNKTFLFSILGNMQSKGGNEKEACPFL